MDITRAARKTKSWLRASAIISAMAMLAAPGLFLGSAHVQQTFVALAAGTGARGKRQRRNSGSSRHSGSPAALSGEKGCPYRVSVFIELSSMVVE